MYRPYRTFYLTRLENIALQNWESRRELEKILNELAERKLKDEVLILQTKIAFRIEHILNEEREQQKRAGLKKHEEVIERIEKRQREREVLEKQGWLEWPETAAPMGDGGMDAHWYKEGLFSSVSYHVGNAGEPTNIRKQLLDCIFHKDLPQVDSLEYMQEFALPKTPQRLNKMADFLSSLAKNFKRNMAKTGTDYTKAIADYEHDLDYLYDQYYVDEFHFNWPEV